MTEPAFLQDETVPEVEEDDITGPEEEWKTGTYAGYSCTYRTVREEDGENVVTKRGNKYARKGDYVVYGLDEAPAGYGSQTVARVIRSDDSNLAK